MALQIQEFKNKIANQALDAFNSNWITKDELSTILSHINSNRLVIGVVGQMKAGKSTLVNTLVFGKDILPTSQTPKTATLTRISYGEKFEFKPHFISEDDLDEIKNKSEVTISDELSDIDKNEIESAKQLYSSIIRVPNYLQMIKGDSPEAIKKSDNTSDEQFNRQLNEYTGADGTYTAITKSIDITYNEKDSLGGIEIVDTPGFNDPITSRNAAAIQFLAQANIIIFLQDINAPFTKVDVDLLKKQIPNQGIGKLIIGLNRKDIKTDEDVLQQVGYAKREIDKILKEGNEEISCMLEDCPIIPLSAMMSLLSNMSSEMIAANKMLSFYYNRIKRKYPQLPKSQYAEESGVSLLDGLILNIIKDQETAENGIESYLFKAPVDKLLGFLTTHKNRLIVEIERLSDENEIYSDKQLDYDQLLRDIDLFSCNARAELMSSISNIEINAINLRTETNNQLMDDRSAFSRNISFVQNDNKKYLSSCYLRINDTYRKYNRNIKTKLRRLSDEINSMIRKEITKLDVAFLDATNNLPSAKQIHHLIIQQMMSKTKKETAYHEVEDVKMNRSLPDKRRERKAIYNEGLTLHFCRMFDSDFKNDYLHTLTNRYYLGVEIILKDMKTDLGNVIDETIDKVSGKPNPQIIMDKNNNIIDTHKNVVRQISDKIEDILRIKDQFGN